uniref:Cyclin-like domain-containing protein n=1 Tax=Anopheles dirus TaxID=7168 RepID=A0A182NYK0_9DIPT
MDRWGNIEKAPGCTDYDDDILETLQEREVNSMKLKFIAPQLQHRPTLVKLIYDVCEKQSYHRTTIHLAIYLLDIFMSGHAISESQLKLVALTCLYVACKVEENDSIVPTPSKLNSFVRNAYNPSDFICLEVRMLQFFDWHLTIPTAATFLDLFDLHSFDRDEYDRIASDPATVPTVFAGYVQRINRTSGMILEASLRCFKLCRIRPSLLAAGCVAAGRSLTQNVPVWSDRLTSVTGYTYRQLHFLCQQLIFEVMPHSPAPSPTSASKRSISDAGYLSEWDDSSSSHTSSASSEDSDESSESWRKRACRLSRDSGASSSDEEEIGGKRRKIADNDCSG